MVDNRSLIQTGPICRYCSETVILEKRTQLVYEKYAQAIAAGTGSLIKANRDTLTQITLYIQIVLAVAGISRPKLNVWRYAMFTVSKLADFTMSYPIWELS